MTVALIITGALVALFVAAVAAGNLLRIIREMSSLDPKDRELW